MKNLIKYLSLGGIFSLCSLAVVFLVSSGGVVINDGNSIKIDYDRVITSDELESSNRRAIAGIEKNISTYKKLAFKEKLEIHKNSSWFLTWIPWIFLPFLLVRNSCLYISYALIPALALVVLDFLWVRELLLIICTLLAIRWVKYRVKK